MGRHFCLISTLMKGTNMKIENKNKTPDKTEENKKSHKGLKIFLAIFIPVFLVIILPIALLYGFFYDPGKNDFTPDTNFNAEQEVSNLALRAFDNTKESGKVDVSLSLDTVNNLVYKSIGQQLESVKIYGTAMSISGNDYILSTTISAAAPIFETRVYLIMNVAHEGSGIDESIVMSIKSIKVGRLGLEAIAMSLLSRAINDSSIEQMFSNLGITVHSDLANRKITMVRSELVQNVKQILADHTSASIFGAMIDNFVELNLINFSHNETIALDVNIDLSSLHNVPTYEDASKEAGFPIDNAKEKTVSALNRNLIDFAHADLAFSYFYYGYDRLGPEGKTYIDTLDLSSIGIIDKAAYVGYGNDLKTTKNINEELMDDADLMEVTTTGKIADISEDILNDSFLGQDLIGYSYSFSGDDKGTKKYNVITMDNFYSNIVNDHIYFVGSISINGYRTKIAIDAVDKKVESGDYKLTLGIENIYYGENRACDSFMDSFYELVGSKVISEWFEIDKVNKTLTLNFSSGLTPTIKAAIDARGGMSISLKGDDISSNGIIELKTKN